MVLDSDWALGIVTFSVFKLEQFTKFMAIKIFSWRYNLCLFIGAFLILGFIPASVHADSDINGNESDIGLPVVPPKKAEEEKPEEPLPPPVPPTVPPEPNQPPPNNNPPGNTTGESPRETTPNLVDPTPTIEAGPDINQPDSQESTGDTEGETAVEIPEEMGQEATSTTDGETPGEGAQNTSEPSINPPIESPTVDLVFSPEVTNAVNDTAVNIIQQSSSPTGEGGISGGDLGGGGGGDPIATTLTALLTGTSVDSTNLNVLVQGLLQILGAPSRDVAEQLVRSLLGLLKDGKVDPRRLWAAINAYNAFIEASRPEFLENPPIELVMIRAILSDLVEAAIAADIRSRN